MQEMAKRHQVPACAVNVCWQRTMHSLIGTAKHRTSNWRSGLTRNTPKHWGFTSSMLLSEMVVIAPPSCLLANINCQNAAFKSIDQARKPPPPPSGPCTKLRSAHYLQNSPVSRIWTCDEKQVDWVWKIVVTCCERIGVRRAFRANPGRKLIQHIFCTRYKNRTCLHFGSGARFLRETLNKKCN